jgi:hypothetical protein
VKTINKISLSASILALAASGVQAQQTISGWGADSGAVSGVSLTDNGNGNFVASGTPSGNADFRADLPSAVTLTAGETLTLSGSMTITSGSMGGGVFRIGLLDYSSLGTLGSGQWSTSTTATGYWWGLPTGGSGVSNPGGGEITGKPASAGNAWFSGTGGYSVPGTGNNNPNSLTAGTYNFSLALKDNGTSMSVAYSMIGGSYSETGTVSDSTMTVPLSFNAAGFFANGSDTAFASPGVSFGSVSETISTVPEPGTIALGITGAAALLFRRRK